MREERGVTGGPGVFKVIFNGRLVIPEGACMLSRV